MSLFVWISSGFEPRPPTEPTGLTFTKRNSLCSSFELVAPLQFPTEGRESDRPRGLKTSPTGA